jgi:hypothetical protein
MKKKKILLPNHSPKLKKEEEMQGTFECMV